MTEVLVSIAVAVAALLWREATEWFPYLAKRLVKAAAKQLPESYVERMAEEWAAEVSAIPGKFSPLVFALSIWWRHSRESVASATHVQLAAMMQRALDLALSSIVLVMLSPLMFVLNLVVAVANKGGVVRAWRRIGRRGRPISVYHYRIPKTPDGCCTQLGRFLVRSRLYLLPCWINILKGELSVVGPYALAQSPEGASTYDQRLRPGWIWASQHPDLLVVEHEEAAAVMPTRYVHAVYLWTRRELREILGPRT